MKQIQKTWWKKFLFTLILGVTLAGICALIVPNADSAWAAEPKTKTEAKTEAKTEGKTATKTATKTEAKLSVDQGISKTLSAMQDIFRVLLVLLNYITWPLLMAIGALMDSDLVIGPGMEPSLLQVWREVRNIVNIFFALALLVIAIYNVLGLGEEGPLSSYAVKKMLPRFVLAVILVNFSFLLSRFVLDVADVMTNAVFAIPEYGVSQLNTDEFEEKMCGNIYSDKFIGNDAKKLTGKTQLCEDKETFTESAKKFFQEEINSNTAAMMLAINMGQLHEQMSVSELIEDLGKSNKTIDFIDFLLNTLFSLVIFLVYAITFGVLAFFLIVRIVVLWLVVALSPLAALLVVIPDEAGIDTGDFDLKDIFLQHAFGPVIIAFSMAIGFMMLTAYQKLGGTFSPGSPESLELSVAISGLTDVHKLIIAAGAIAVVWVGTFAAAGKSQIIGTVTENLKSTLQNWGKEVAMAWKYATIIPIQTGDGKESLTPNQLLEAFKSPSTTVQKAVEAAEDPNKSFLDSFRKGAAGAGGALALDQLRIKLQGKNINSESEFRDILPHVKPHLDDPDVRIKFSKKLQEATEKGWTKNIDDKLLNKSALAAAQATLKAKQPLDEQQMKRLFQNTPEAASGTSTKNPDASSTPDTPAQPPFGNREQFDEVLNGPIDENKWKRITETQTKGVTAGLKDVATDLASLGEKDLEKVNALQKSGNLKKLFGSGGLEKDHRQIVVNKIKGDDVSGEQASEIVDAVHGAMKGNPAARDDIIEGVDDAQAKKIVADIVKGLTK